jgi:multicomponent Na+:H+ antiporter subunit F
VFSEVLILPDWVLLCAHILLGLALLLTGIRLLLGDTTANRLVALDLLGALVMCEAVLLIFSSHFLSFLDVALAIAIISFLATVALSRYLQREGGEP